MSEAKFFPLKKFLIVNRGDEIPENVTVLCDGGRELVIKHANSFEARRELQYQAKLLGANALLNVHVDWFSPGGLTRYMAYGTPAVCGRKHFKGTMTAAYAASSAANTCTSTDSPGARSLDGHCKVFQVRIYRHHHFVGFESSRIIPKQNGAQSSAVLLSTILNYLSGSSVNRL